MRSDQSSSALIWDNVETGWWAWQRDDGGRSLAFIGGHSHANWKIDGLRKAILNAILWTAGAEVPAEGVESPLPEK